MTKQVTFDKPKLDRLKAAYNKAVEAGVDTFVFEGDEFVTGYAKYLIQYLEPKLK